MAGNLGRIMKSSTFKYVVYKHSKKFAKIVDIYCYDTNRNNLI